MFFIYLALIPFYILYLFIIKRELIFLTYVVVSWTCNTIKQV